MNGWDEHRFHQWLRRMDQVGRYAPLLVSASDGENLVELGRRVEVMAAEILVERGHQVALTSHRAAVDVRAGGAGVEVKAARYREHEASRGGRYQAAIRNGQADLVLLACVDQAGWIGCWFVIPGRAIGERRNIAIWSQDPEAYSGRWARYREAWDVADVVISAAGPCMEQMSLWPGRRAGSPT